MDAVKYFFLCLLTYWHIRWFSFCTWWNDSLIFTPSIICGYDGKSVTQKRALRWPCRCSALKTSILKNCETYVSVVLSYLVCGIFYSRPNGMKTTSFLFHWFFSPSFSSSSSFFPRCSCHLFVAEYQLVLGILLGRAIKMWSNLISKFINEYFLVQITFATWLYFITIRNQIMVTRRHPTTQWPISNALPLWFILLS